MNNNAQNPIRITGHSGIYTLKTVQTLPIDPDAAWEFFSNPANLSKITPSEMGFNITSEPGNETHAGQIITYKVAIFPGINVNWVTEITHLEPGRAFVDEQRFGPYSMWHHQHIFEPSSEGVVMTDIVSYKLPLGIIGRLFHGPIVKPQLLKIFGFRRKTLQQFFSEHAAETV